MLIYHGPFFHPPPSYTIEERRVEGQDHIHEKKQSLKRLSQNKNKSPGAGQPCLSVGQSAFPNGTPSRNVNSKGVTTAIIMIRMSLRGHQHLGTATVFAQTRTHPASSDPGDRIQRVKGA